MLKTLLSAIFLTIVSANISNAQLISKIAPKREFRGVWVATVSNIDWPSKPGLSVEQQKKELLDILDKHKSQGMNAILLQIRPAADAFYAKSREPWSQWLMGKQGLAPTAGYDPLAFAIKECHERGMELHAWFNPYRASVGIAPLSATHPAIKKPEWFFKYGGKYQFDPGIPEVREYIVQVILDVVKEYDIDGVHFDDYFYPYAIAGQKINDSNTFYKYPNNFSDIKEWRRNNVNLLIKQLDDSIHHYKKHVKFGISPFGIWRNKNEDPEGSESNGLSNYSELFADSRKWVKEGWVDYINPQVYFTFSRKAAPFAKLVNWWSDNTYGRHLYIGQAGYLVNSRSELAWRNLSEIPNQLRYIRANNRIQGTVFFSSKSMNTVAKSVSDSLKNDFYKYQALPPQMPWLDETPPNPPQQFTADALKDGVHLKWLRPLKAKDGETFSGFVIYRFEEGEKISVLDPKNIIKISFEDLLSFIDATVLPGKRYNYLITALDRLKNESEAIGPLGIETTGHKEP